MAAARPSKPQGKSLRALAARATVPASSSRPGHLRTSRTAAEPKPRNRLLPPAAAAGPARLATERVFAELASLAGIPVDSYAIGEEVEGALCLLQTEQGFEVFHSSNGNRHELQYFCSEEAACFYLFGVLAADAVRKGALLSAAGPTPGRSRRCGSRLSESA